MKILNGRRQNLYFTVIDKCKINPKTDNKAEDETDNKANDKTDNKGFSLIELIIAMAIFTIVIAITISFLATGSKNYSSARDEVDLQMESQIILNQLEDMAIESYWIAYKDVSSDVKALLLYKDTYVDIIFWDKTMKKLYLVDDQAITYTEELSLITYTEEKNLMAENVEKFNMPTSSADILKDNKIQLEITFVSGTKTFPTVLNAYLRNQPQVPQASAAPIAKKNS